MQWRIRLHGHKKFQIDISCLPAANMCVMGRSFQYLYLQRESQDNSHSKSWRFSMTSDVLLQIISRQRWVGANNPSQVVADAGQTACWFIARDGCLFWARKKLLTTAEWNKLLHLQFLYDGNMSPHNALTVSVLEIIWRCLSSWLHKTRSCHNGCFETMHKHNVGSWRTSSKPLL